MALQLQPKLSDLYDDVKQASALCTGAKPQRLDTTDETVKQTIQYMFYICGGVSFMSF